MVVISLDTLRYDHLSFYGYERPISPQLDHLAQQGVVFEEVIAQAPWTAPSHASLLTSLYPSVLGSGPTHDPGRISDAAESLAEVLRDSGRRTQAFVGGGFVRAELGFDQGFQGFDATAGRGGFAQLIDRTLAWIDREPKQPFFLFLHTYAIHNYTASHASRQKWIDPYGGALALDAELFRRLQEGPNDPAFLATLGSEEWRVIRQLYDAAIADADAEVGRFVAGLETRGLLDSTLIVILSDHGEEHDDHGSSGHGYTLYDENIRVPLLLYNRGLPHIRVSEPVRLLDVAPTIATLCGVPPAPSWQGTSLVPLIDGDPLELVAFSEASHYPMKSARTKDEKFIAVWQQSHVPGTSPFAYFDLARDPNEATNAFALAPSRAAPLRQSMIAWVESTGMLSRFRASEPHSLSANARRDLEALGYVGADSKPQRVDATPRVDEPMFGFWLEFLHRETAADAR